MGYAQGELMSDVAPQFFDAVWNYILVQVVRVYLFRLER